MGERGESSGIRHQRCSDVRDVGFLRREVAEKVEAWMKRAGGKAN